MLPKRPRHWAEEILSAQTDDAKGIIFQSIPQAYRDWVVDLVVSAEGIRKFHKRKPKEERRIYK